MRLVLYIQGFLSLCLGVSMLVPLCIAVATGGQDRGALMASALVCFLLGGLAVMFPPEERDLDLRQAFLVVSAGWLLAGLLGALPFYFATLFDPALKVHFPGYVDCFFESVSGFSTTGASILSDIESVPRGLLFWRSLTHWLGGMGIIVLSIAILPLLGGGGMTLYKAEAPGGILPDKLSPRIAQTARSMWWVYILMTVAETFLLMAGGMTLFDALCHTFGTVATGGFSTKNASVAAYDSTYIHLVIAFFMFLAGVNFFLHYRALRGEPTSYFKDSEFRFYGILTAIATLVIFLDVAPLYAGELLIGLRDSLFQVLTVLTTTGYATADFEVWPNVARFLLVALMVVGGSTGSTAGGCKCLRVQIFFKTGYRELQRLLHPHAIIPVRIGKRAIPDQAVASVMGFLTCVIGLFMVASLALAWMGMDLETAYTAVIACIFNIGPGLGQVGPANNYGWMPDPAKVLLGLCMILGRLEVYTVLVLFTPEYYKR